MSKQSTPMYDQDLLDYKKYLEIKGYAESTVKSLLKGLKRYKQSVLSPREYVENKKETGFKPGSINSIIYILDTYHEYLRIIKAEKQYNIKLRKEKIQRTLPEILNIEEVKELFKKSKDLRDKAILVCLYHLGLRVGECSHLQEEDLDFTQNTVLITKSKTGYQRKVPLNKGAKEILQNYISTKTGYTGNLLQGLQGDLTADGITQILRKMVKRTKIKKKVYPHLLRHSIASHLLQRGMDLEHIAKFLGHRSLESTQIYTHLKEL